MVKLQLQSFAARPFYATGHCQHTSNRFRRSKISSVICRVLCASPRGSSRCIVHAGCPVALLLRCCALRTNRTQLHGAQRPRRPPGVGLRDTEAILAPLQLRRRQLRLPPPRLEGGGEGGRAGCGQCAAAAAAALHHKSPPTPRVGVGGGAA